MAQNAALIKLHAPNTNTFLQVIYARWGRTAHITFLFFALATNLFVCAVLLVGASATIEAMTGMSTIASCFLIPVITALYVVVGGFRSTLLKYVLSGCCLNCLLTLIPSDYSHAGVI
jgi:Na+/proline symporter